MKAITINVSDPVYRDFQEYARTHDRTTSELIREAMEVFHQSRIKPRPSLADSRPVAAGRVLIPFTGAEDTLEEMLHDDRG